MLKIISFYFYIFTVIFLGFSIFLRDYLMFNGGNFLLFTYFVLVFPFVDMVFNFFQKKWIYLFHSYSSEINHYYSKIHIFFTKLPYCIYFLLWISFWWVFQLFFFESYYFLSVYIIFLVYFFYWISSLYLFYLSFLFLLILPYFYLQEHSFTQVIFSYFFLFLISWIVQHIFEKLKCTGKKIYEVFLTFLKWMSKKFLDILKNQDYTLIFSDVLSLFFIFFVLSFFSVVIFDTLVVLFSFVLFVYIIGKIFGLQFVFFPTIKDLKNNKISSLFVFFIGIFMIFLYFQNLISPNYKDIFFPKEVTHPFEDENLNITEELIPEKNQESQQPLVEEIVVIPRTFDITQFQENLWIGSTWESVKILQYFLNEYGYYNFSIDGNYDMNTQSAMRRFLSTECNWSETNQWILWPQARSCIEQFLSDK